MTRQNVQKAMEGAGLNVREFAGGGTLVGSCGTAEVHAVIGSRGWMLRNRHFGASRTCFAKRLAQVADFCSREVAASRVPGASGINILPQPQPLTGIAGATLQRAQRAMALAVTMAAPGVYQVQGGAEPHWVNLVDASVPACDCGDYLFRERICKHQMAARFAAGEHPHAVLLEALRAEVEA